MSILFSIGLGFTGLSFLASIPALALRSDGPGIAYAWSIWINLVFVSSALTFLMLGGLVAAAGAKAAESKVNDLGREAGVGAVAGRNWIAMSWAGIAFMVAVLLYWAGRVVGWRRARRSKKEEEAAKEKEEEAMRMRYQLPRFESYSRPRRDYDRREYQRDYRRDAR